MQNNSIAIVGCGIAGISASIELIKRGIPHTIFEAKNFIGGRFYSFYDKHLGFEIDNGQHLFSSAYDNFFSLIEFLGTLKYVEKLDKPEILFFQSNNHTIKLKEIFFTGKVGTLFGLLFFNYLPFRSRISVLKFFLHLNDSKTNGNESTNAFDYLLLHKQERSTIDKFWNPIAVSIFNNSLQRIPANLFVETLKLAFLRNSRQNGFTYSIVPQSHLIVRFPRILEKNGGKLLLATSVQKIQKNGNHFEIQTNSNQKFLFDYVILCVQPNVLKRLLPDDWLQMSYFDFLHKVNFNPIVSIYVTTPNEITTSKFGFLSNSSAHWIFNKTRMCKLNFPPYLYSFTTSNAHQLHPMQQSELIKMIEEDVNKLFNKKVSFINSKVIKDKFATIDLDIEFNKLRPKQESPIDGLFIAGDWTQTGLPATLESAALSGKLAVLKMLNYLNRI
ncbi:MAG: hydroxysqualene dehydroxylase [Candidatus Kapaibacteriota bacterium]